MKTDNRNPQTDWQDDALDRLLADAKVEFDEAWMKEAESHIPAGMDERLLNTIARLEEQDRKTLTHRRWSRWAAVGLLIVSLGIGWGLSNIGEPMYTDTCATPEEAQLQLERALVTLNMNGKRAVKQARKTMREAQPSQPQSKFISIE